MLNFDLLIKFEVDSNIWSTMDVSLSQNFTTVNFDISFWKITNFNIIL